MIDNKKELGDVLRKYIFEIYDKEHFEASDICDVLEDVGADLLNADYAKFAREVLNGNH